jgi:SpoVK/Ycf46/Vps4 family AAA+-type ATPase
MNLIKHEKKTNENNKKNREHAPSIIFMDEIDSIGSSRVEGSQGGDSEVQRTMLELLNQLDGFEATQNIKVGVVWCVCVLNEMRVCAKLQNNCVKLSSQLAREHFFHSLILKGF